MSFNLKRNSLLAALEMIVNGLALFFIYRNVVQVLGVSMLGVWSLVLATTAFGRAADVGISAGLARFVARALGEDSPKDAILYMRTGFIAIALFMGFVALALWYPLWLSLGIALEGEELELARALLPWAILSFWLLNLKSVLDASLLGIHRADLRSVSSISGMAFQLAASLALVGSFGLYGLAWAQAGQFLLAFLMALVFLSMNIKMAQASQGEGSVWFSWSKLKEMAGFGIKLQIGTIANLLFEPAVKVVLGAVAGTAVLGIFEMAYRMAYQVRNVAIVAIQTTVPAFADLQARGSDELLKLFSKTCRNASIAAAVLMPALALGSPLVSWLWLGEVNQLFIYISALMSIMWGFAIVCAPAFFLGVATGRIAPNIIGQILPGLLAPTLVYILGTSIGAVVAICGVLIGKVPGVLLPAIFTRPNNSLHHGVLFERSSLASIAFILLICGGVLLYAQPSV